MWEPRLFVAELRWGRSGCRRLLPGGRSSESALSFRLAQPAALGPFPVSSSRLSLRSGLRIWEPDWTLALAGRLILAVCSRFADLLFGWSSDALIFRYAFAIAFQEMGKGCCECRRFGSGGAWRSSLLLCWQLAYSLCPHARIPTQVRPRRTRSKAAAAKIRAAEVAPRLLLEHLPARLRMQATTMNKFPKRSLMTLPESFPTWG